MICFGNREDTFPHDRKIFGNHLLQQFPHGVTAAMATIEAAAFSIISSSSSHPSTSPKCSLHSLKLPISTCAIPFSLKCPLYSLPPLHSTRKPRFQVCSTSTVEEVVTVEEKTEPTEEKTESSPQTNHKRKLFVINLPWSLTVADIKTLFGECGTVTDVEIIKQQDGKNRGFAFVTMASGEEAQAAIKKFDSHELSGRIIRVELAKRFKKPPHSPPEVPSHGESRHKLYASNLAWKVRSKQLKEFFSAYSPVSTRVVFNSPSGQSAGYGFISFATKEEAEAAISSLEGKELLGRPIKLKFSQKKDDKSENEVEGTTEEQPADQ